MKKFASMFAVCGVACVFALAISGAARADEILQYSFDSGSFFNFVGYPGYDYATTGAFDYDATTQTADVTSGIYVQDDLSGDLPDVEVVSPTELTFSDGVNAFTYDFAQSLALGGTDAITGGSDPGFSITAGGSVTAAASTPVPEPITLSLFGAGLAGAVAVGRRRKKVTAA